MKKRNIVQKGVTFALTAAMVGSSFVSAFPVLAAEDDSKSIVALTTDGLTNPLGVDTLTPVFTWQMESGKTGASRGRPSLICRTSISTFLIKTGK